MGVDPGWLEVLRTLSPETGLVTKSCLLCGAENMCLWRSALYSQDGCGTSEIVVRDVYIHRQDCFRSRSVMWLDKEFNQQPAEFY